MDDKYIELTTHGIKINVKMDEEGVVVDVWQGDDVIASTWRTYEELSMEVKHVDYE